tara:strand:- start:856 stop:1497 length:642 start_codon:yes stop_codon:yes gene_type:complete
MIISYCIELQESILKKKTSYRNLLQEHYRRCIERDNSKAAKDVVGASFEACRGEWIRSFDKLDTASPSEKREFDKLYGSYYEADQYIVCKSTRRIIAVEEDKGHYVDKPFAKRALFNAAELMHHCIKSEIDLPFFVLSCPTNYDITSLLGSKSGFFNKAIYKALVDKFRFFPTCQHGRVAKRRYLVDREMPFEMDDDLVLKETKFFEYLQGQA